MATYRFLAAITVAICVAMHGALAQPSHAYHRNIPYDPSKCSTDAHNMVYFAVGLRVLRQPRENLIYIQGYNLNELNSLPTPPRLNDPEGCPDHPIQGAAYTFKRFSAMPDEVTTAISTYADAIHVIVNAGTGVADRTGTFRLFCEKFAPRDIAVPGMIGCRNPLECFGDTAYQTTEYRTPIGDRISLFCEVALIGCAPRLVGCQGAYQLRDDFAVNFTFATAALPLEKFIEADQELRRRIDAAEVTQFNWLK
jgi:hypothetical protein